MKFGRQRLIIKFLGQVWAVCKFIHTFTDFTFACFNTVFSFYEVSEQNDNLLVRISVFPLNVVLPEYDRIEQSVVLSQSDRIRKHIYNERVGDAESQTRS